MGPRDFLTTTPASTEQMQYGNPDQKAKLISLGTPLVYYLCNTPRVGLEVWSVSLLFGGPCAGAMSVRTVHGGETALEIRSYHCFFMHLPKVRC
jgi:hypothetical protein